MDRNGRLPKWWHRDYAGGVERGGPTAATVIFFWGGLEEAIEMLELI